MVEASLVYNERNASQDGDERTVPHGSANAIGCVEVDSGEESGDEVCVVDSQTDGSEFSDDYSDCFSVHSGSTDDVAAAALPLASVSVYTDSEEESSEEEAKVAPLALLLERDGLLTPVETPLGTPTAPPTVTTTAPPAVTPTAPPTETSAAPPTMMTTAPPTAPPIVTTAAAPIVTTTVALTATPTAMTTDARTAMATETSTVAPTVEPTVTATATSARAPTETATVELPHTLPARVPSARPTLLVRKPAHSRGTRAVTAAMVTPSTPSGVALDGVSTSSMADTSEQQKMMHSVSPSLPTWSPSLARTARMKEGPTGEITVPTASNDQSPKPRPTKSDSGSPGHSLPRRMQAAQKATRSRVAVSNTAAWHGNNADPPSRRSRTCNGSRSPPHAGERRSGLAVRTSPMWPPSRSQSRSTSRIRSHSRSRSGSRSHSPSKSTWSRHHSPPTAWEPRKADRMVTARSTMPLRTLKESIWPPSRSRSRSGSPPLAALPWSPRSSFRARYHGSERVPAFLTPVARSANTSTLSRSESRSQSRSRSPPATRPTSKTTRLAQITATLSTPQMQSVRQTAQLSSRSQPPPPGSMNAPRRSVIPRFLQRASTESMRSCSRSPSFSPLRKRHSMLSLSPDHVHGVQSPSRSRSPPLVATRHIASMKSHNYSPRRRTNSTRSTSPTAAARSNSSSPSSATDDDQLSNHHYPPSGGYHHNLPPLVRTPCVTSSLRPYDHMWPMVPHPLTLPAPPTMRILPPPIRPASSSVQSTMRPAPIPPVRGGFPMRNALSESSVQSKIEQLKADAVKKGEQPEAGQGISDGQCPLLSILQGTWSSSFRNDRVVVDLIWVYIRGQKSNHTLTRVKNMWRWSGWSLIEIQDGKLRWEKFGCIVVWTRVGPIPELQCNSFDLTGDESSPNSGTKALRLLKRTFEISETVRTHANSELYGLEFTQSNEGVFAACLLLRAPNEKISMIIYFATRSPIQGLGFGKIMLERVMEAPVRAQGCGECKRWAAIVRRKTRSKTNDAAMWWRKSNFVKDVTAELEDANPFEDCIALEYEEHPSKRSKRVARGDKSEGE
eukprot:GEMP01002337.1.p1 GENE.GEMP01002337.1~~GEMP01002337.1.p1  ORF type:complete len:1069 (+),score=205.97 GEMP01002337.1:150-3356(+)